MDHLLKPPHRVEELLRQVDHLLAVLPPKIFEDLRVLHLDRAWLILQILDKVGVFFLAVSQLVAHLANFAVEASILTIEQV